MMELNVEFLTLNLNSVILTEKTYMDQPKQMKETPEEFTFM